MSSLSIELDRSMWIILKRMRKLNSSQREETLNVSSSKVVLHLYLVVRGRETREREATLNVSAPVNIGRQANAQSNYILCCSHTRRRT